MLTRRVNLPDVVAVNRSLPLALTLARFRDHQSVFGLHLRKGVPRSDVTRNSAARGGT